MYACITRETFVFTVFRRVFHLILKRELCRHACRRRDQIIPTCRYGKNMPTTALLITLSFKYINNFQIYFISDMKITSCYGNNCITCTTVVRWAAERSRVNLVLIFTWGKYFSLVEISQNIYQMTNIELDTSVYSSQINSGELKRLSECVAFTIILLIM